jgi:hypothetical protein
MTDLHVVSQNISDDGPAPTAQIVLTQESSSALVKRNLNGYRVEAGTNHSLVTAWDAPGLGFEASYTRHVHDGEARFTPSRDLFVCLFNTTDHGKVATINGHAINSAWAPLWARVPQRRRRRRLWNLYIAAIEREVAELHQRGYVVILGADLNRLGDWQIKGLRDCHGSGLGRIWVSTHRRVRVLDEWRGPKVGDNKVTHHADHVLLRINP